MLNNWRNRVTLLYKCWTIGEILITLRAFRIHWMLRILRRRPNRPLLWQISHLRNLLTDLVGSVAGRRDDHGFTMQPHRGSAMNPQAGRLQFCLSWQMKIHSMQAFEYAGAITNTLKLCVHRLIYASRRNWTNWPKLPIPIQDGVGCLHLIFLWAVFKRSLILLELN